MPRKWPWEAPGRTISPALAFRYTALAHAQVLSEHLDTILLSA